MRNLLKISSWSFRIKKRTFFLFGAGLICMLTTIQLVREDLTKLMIRSDFGVGCSIQFPDPYLPSSKKMIEDDGKLLGGAPRCIGAPVRFSIDNDRYLLVRKNINSTYWDTVHCCYTVFKQGPGNNIINEDTCFSITQDYTNLPYEHQNLDIKCTDKEGHGIVYRDQLPVFRTIPTLESTIDKISSGISGDRFSVLILGLDSVSRPNFVRFMEKSHRFLKDDLEAVEFFRFNKVGRGTPENLVPMLTGCKLLTPPDQPYTVAKHCDLIWEKFAEYGFRTLQFEDGGYNEHKLYPVIRKNKPGIGTHYNLSTFMDGVRKIDVEEMGNTFEDGFGCFDNQFVMDVFAGPILAAAKELKDKPYFNFVWFGKPAHAVMSNTKYMDEPTHKLMKKMKDLGLLEKTILFVLSDHGPWQGDFLSTFAGSLEPNLPTLFVSFPKSFKQNYPQAYRNIVVNSNRLTTPYDLFATLSDLTDLSQLTNLALAQRLGHNVASKLGQSLFTPIPPGRTCEIANIPPEVCACFYRSTILNPESSIDIQEAVAYTVSQLNSQLQLFPQCARLKFKQLKTATRLGIQSTTSQNVDRELLEITFSTFPADAEFQVTLSIESKLTIIGEALRRNAYKGQSDCIGSWANATFAKTVCMCTDNLH